MTDFVKKSLYHVNAKDPVRFIDTTTDAHDGCIYHLVVVGENGMLASTKMLPIDEYDFGDGNKVDLNVILKGSSSSRNKSKIGVPFVLKYDCVEKKVIGAKALVQDFTTAAQTGGGVDDSMVFNPAISETTNIPRNNGRIAIQGSKILVSVLLDLKQIYGVNSKGKIIIDGVEHTVSVKSPDTTHGVTIMFQMNRHNFKVTKIVEPGNPPGERRTVDSGTVTATSRNTDCIFDMVVDGGHVYYLGMVCTKANGGFVFRKGEEPIAFTNLGNTDRGGLRTTFLLKLNRNLEVMKAVHIGHLVTRITTNSIKEFSGDSLRRFTLAVNATKLYIAGQTSCEGTDMSIGEKTLTQLAKNRPIILSLNKELKYVNHRFFDTDERDRFTDIKVNGSAIFVAGHHRLNEKKPGGLPSSYYTETRTENVTSTFVTTAAIFKLAHDSNFKVLHHYYVESDCERNRTVSAPNLYAIPQHYVSMNCPVLELTESGAFLSTRLQYPNSTASEVSETTGDYYVPMEQTADERLILYSSPKVRDGSDSNMDGSIVDALFHFNMDLQVKKLGMEGGVNSANSQTTVNHTNKIVFSRTSLFSSYTIGGNTNLENILVRDAQFPSKVRRFPWDKPYDVNQCVTAASNSDAVVSGVFEYGFNVR